MGLKKYKNELELIKKANAELEWFKHKKKEFKAKLTLTDSKILAIENKFCWTMVNFLTDVILDVKSLDEKNFEGIKTKYYELDENFVYMRSECQKANFNIQYYSYDELLKITGRLRWVLS